MATKQAVPLDIIETVIDCLAGVDDQKHTSIKVCSLACRSFVHFCRKHIFASVTLDNQSSDLTPTSPTSSQFRKLLSTSPEIVNYVRKLAMALPADLRKAEMDDLRLVELSGLLKKFTRIQDLALQSQFEDILPNVIGNDWNNLPHHLQDSVLHLLDLPTIERVQLSCVECFPMLELARCANLRYFHLDEQGRTAANLISALPPRSIMLHELYLCRGHSVRDMILTPAWPDGQPLFDLNNLKKYSASWYWRDDVNVARQILKMTDKLVSIDLTLATSQSLDVSGLSAMVSHLKSLRRICLRHMVNSGIHNTRKIFAGLPNELRNMRQNHHALEQIDIYVTWKNFLDWDLFTEDEWSILDDVLNNPRWSSLKTVSIEIKGKWFNTDTTLTSVLRALPQLHLPILLSNQDINFDFKLVNRLDKDNV